MFERYTEKARRVIFFARYEASQFGSPFIETEHLLLGVLREDKKIASRFLRSYSIESIRKQIESRTMIRDKVSTSVDLPISQECKRVLAYAAEEAERLNHKHIGTEHLLLGLLREEKCFAAEILTERGLSLEKLREELSHAEPARAPTKPAERGSPLSGFSRDLTQAAMEDQLERLVGRGEVVDRVIQILCRQSKNNPVLVGHAGVGRRAVVHGTAQLIAGTQVPSRLSGIPLIAVERAPSAAQISALTELAHAILFIEDLRTPGRLLPASFLKPALSGGAVQCIATATPDEFKNLMEEEPWVERYFLPVNVPPPSDDESIQILSIVKKRLEAFHDVNYTDEALKFAVAHSKRFIPDRALPGIAIDLMDEAGVAITLRRAALPEEMVDCKKRIAFVMHRMENAIANHEFEKARFYSDEERKERENLRQLSDKYNLEESEAGTVTVDNIEEAVAAWTGVPIATIRQARTV